MFKPGEKPAFSSCSGDFTRIIAFLLPDYGFVDSFEAPDEAIQGKRLDKRKPGNFTHRNGIYPRTLSYMLSWTSACYFL